ncbi:uncharacterized protein LOC133172108 [Saccostrea echinata]|uniref:uncharacterized protein LOC133172108 n=1 Tax=Saccostrea echinata TaxID=191078 RepID=UPI002A83E1D4|nr:uncharacterized protein LOC133172108 [Saccostrea echinata]
MASGVALSDECLDVYQDLQGSKKKYRYIIYKLNDDFSEIVVDTTKPREEGGVTEAYEEFCSKLFEAAENRQGRYGVFDIHYNVDTRELDKVVFFTWVADTLPIKQKMLYASSAKALRGKMTGVHTEIQCNDASDLKLESVIAKCRQKSYE